MVPVMLARSKTATGMAWRSETRLPMSTRALTVGMSPRWESLRSSASAVLAAPGRFGAKLAEDVAPRGDLGEVRYRGRLQPLGGGP